MKVLPIPCFISFKAKEKLAHRPILVCVSTTAKTKRNAKDGKEDDEEDDEEDGEEDDGDTITAVYLCVRRPYTANDSVDQDAFCSLPVEYELGVSDGLMALSMLGLTGPLKEGGAGAGDGTAAAAAGWSSGTQGGGVGSRAGTGSCPMVGVG